MGDDAFKGWAILELMGHRRLAGMVADVQMFGCRFCRIDIPSEPPVTQYYGGGAIYCLTPTTEEIALAVARRSTPPPHTLGLPVDVPARPAPDDIDTGDPYECEDCGADIESEGASLCDNCREAENHDSALVDAAATATALEEAGVEIAGARDAEYVAAMNVCENPGPDGARCGLCSWCMPF